MRLKLIRDKVVLDATLGRLYCEGEFIAYTCENLWLDNKPQISCVPPGTYGLDTKTYGRFYDVVKVPIPILRDTEPRTEILIHWGNYSTDTLGCILVGKDRDENIGAVWNSRQTWHKIHPYLSQSVAIEIIDETNAS